MASIQEIAKALEARSFKAQVFATKEEAKKAAMELIGSESVGIGGSVTVDETGIYEALSENGNKVFWHWKDTGENSNDIQEKAAHAMWYLSSANAITNKGLIVNIDGKGNRVAAQIYGPKKQIMFVGKNKLVDGGIDEAIDHIKKYACGPNAKRLGIDTPCSITNKCVDCNHPRRICRATTILSRPTIAMTEYYIFLIDENLGY